MPDRQRSKRKVKAPAVGATPATRGGPRAPEAARITAGKRPAVIAEPKPDDGRLVVRFNQVDLDGPWCPTKITPPDHKVLLTRLRDIEQQTAHEVFNSGSNTGAHYEVGEIPNPAAERRLDALGFGDETRVSRLRITKKHRLHGILKRNHFYALWWDPDHSVWPTSK